MVAGANDNTIAIGRSCEYAAEIVFDGLRQQRQCRAIDGEKPALETVSWFQTHSAPQRSPGIMVTGRGERALGPTAMLCSKWVEWPAIDHR